MFTVLPDTLQFKYHDAKLMMLKNYGVKSSYLMLCDKGMRENKKIFDIHTHSQKKKKEI